ncbi:MAG: DUF4350 domain-containing protein [Azoarcus sp.]|jgi:hypothetical protein|nr:DUF4350 domain-containing protein [Azoarcus sp.]
MRISIWKLIGSLLLLAFCLWIYSRVEYVEREITTDFQGIAARNPLLAAGRLAEHHGAVAHYVPAYSKPPRSAATLVFTAPRHLLSKEQNDALLDWVKTTGGHLIISPQYSQDRDKNMRWERKKNREKNAFQDFRDPLLDLLDISVKFSPAADDKEQQQKNGKSSGKEEPGKVKNEDVSDEDDSDEAIEENSSDKEDSTEAFLELLRKFGLPKWTEPQTIELPEGTHLKAWFNPRLRLDDLEEGSDWRISEPAADSKNNGNKGDLGLSYVLGRGRITVLANLDFINNNIIGKDDHAALFVYLVSLAKGQDIWFVYGSDVPALWRWFVDHAWRVLLAAALLLVTWLWMISRRFGPLLPARSADRRSIAEHVAASARYLWRGKQGQALYQTLCDDFYNRAYLRYPQWSRLSAQELNRQIVLFAHETGIPQLSALTGQAVEHLLDISRSRDKKQFASNSHLLDILRNKL